MNISNLKRIIIPILWTKCIINVDLYKSFYALESKMFITNTNKNLDIIQIIINIYISLLFTHISHIYSIFKLLKNIKDYFFQILNNNIQTYIFKILNLLFKFSPKPNKISLLK